MPADHPINHTVSVHITRAIPLGLLGRVVADGQEAEQKAIVRTREIAWGEPRPVEDYIGQTLPAVVIGYNILRGTSPRTRAAAACRSWR